MKLQKELCHPLSPVCQRTQLLALTLALLSFASGVRAQDCNLYPIALSASSLSNVTVGTILTDILQGEQPGNFGWLTWGGSPSVPPLVTSLTPPGNSTTYVNFDNSADHQATVGDWVRGKPAVSNNQDVRDALDNLKSFDIMVPIWDQTRGQGAQVDYHVAGFARVRLISY